MPRTHAEQQLESTDKLRELVLYVCTASENDEAFGSVKLNKLLFYSDFFCYLHHGVSITGQEYQKLKNGPAPRIMLPLMNDMQASKELAIAKRNYFGLSQKRPLALREANLGAFTAREIAIVNQAQRYFQQHNGMEISEISHKFPGWQLAEEGETIPYSSVLLHKGEITLQERQWAQQLDLTDVQAALCA